MVVPVRTTGLGSARLRSAAGRWRDVLTGEERSLSEDAGVAELVRPFGLGLFERACSSLTP